MCLLAALILSRAKRRLFLIIGLSVIIISLVQIISTRALRPRILNHIQDASYRPAVSIVYDTLAASFQNTAMTIFIYSIAFLALALVLHKLFIAKNQP